MTTDRLVEIRVHGVHGTPPETMLGDSSARQVSGDQEARFFRRSVTQPEERWTVEAFHWGRMTSGAVTRVLWLLLLPFALLNLARYALLTWDDALGQPEPKRGVPSKIADGLLRVIGLVVTLSLVVTAVYIPVELVVNQCLPDRAGCVTRNAWLGFASDWTFGQALLLGAVPVAIVLVGIALLGRRPPTYAPGKKVRWLFERKFGDEQFWNEVAEVRQLRACHLAASAALAGVLFGSVLETSRRPVGQQTEAYHQALGTALGIAGTALTVTCALVVATIASPLSAAVARWLPGLCGLYAVGALVATAGVLWDERGPARARPHLAGLETVTNLGAFASALLLLLLAGLCAWLTVRFRRRERAYVTASSGQGERPRAFEPLWKGFGPVVAVALGSGLLLGATCGAAFQVADLLGRPAEAGGVAPPDGVVLSTSYWTGAWAVGACLVALLLVVLPVAAVVRQRTYAAVAFVAASLVVLVDAEFGWTPGVGTGRATAVAAGILALIGVAAWWWDTGVRRPPGADADDAGGGKRVDDELVDPEQRRRRVARARLKGQAKFRYSLPIGVVAAVLGLAVTLGGVAAGVRLLDPAAQMSPPPWLAALLGAAPPPTGPGGPTDPDRPTVVVAAFGAWTAAALVVVLLGLGYRALRRPETGVGIGILWDLMSFWPRLVHPLCPPPYGGRAVLELVARTQWYLGRGSKVVLSGHSQGSLICVAAATLLVQDSVPDGGQNDLPQEVRAAQAEQRLGLLTYGSQLQWAYARLFPCFVGFHHQLRLYRALHGHWRNLYRTTDPLGGPVLSWPGNDVTAFRVPAVAEWGTHRHQLSAAAGGAGPHCDVGLRDPSTTTRVQERVLPAVAGHSGYDDDPTFAEHRDAVLGTAPSSEGSDPPADEKAPAASSSETPVPPAVEPTPQKLNGHETVVVRRWRNSRAALLVRLSWTPRRR